MDINEIKPYERNARYNEKAIPVVAESIREFGLKGQIVLESRDNFTPDRMHSTANYGNTRGDVNRTCVIKAKLSPSARVVSYSALHNMLSQESPKVRSAFMSDNAISLYAMYKGYNVITSGSPTNIGGADYLNVIDRSALIVSDQFTAK